MPRIIHSSDLHLGEVDYSHKAYGRAAREKDEDSLSALTSMAKEERADLLVIAGDLFDHNRVADEVVNLVVRKLGSLAAPVVILPGNHDCIVPESIYHRVDLHHEAKNFYVFSLPEGETFSFADLDLAIWGRPIIDHGEPLRPMHQIPPRGPERWQLAVAHGHYVGADRTSPNSLQIYDEDILRSQRDYIALGHWDGFIDISQGRTTACYSGSLSGFGVAALVDLDESHGPRVTCLRAQSNHRPPPTL